MKDNNTLNSKFDFDFNLDFEDKKSSDKDLFSSDDICFDTDKLVLKDDEESDLTSNKRIQFKKDTDVQVIKNTEEQLDKYSSKDTKSLDEIIEYAHREGASDIHIIVGSQPVIRVHKVMEDIPDTEVLTPEAAKRLIDLCLTQRERKVLEVCGEVDFSIDKGNYGRFRVNVFKQKGFLSMALRKIAASIPEFDELQLPEVIKDFANNHKGLVLVTGATGSGKSTTLASLINIINSNKKHHIITIEDPIEYVHNHKKCKVNQREIGNDTNSFASALRATLREDPDVILVGEMRDPETIKIALTAAETGHLVFSTLHTIGAAKTIDRIVDSFPSDSQNQIRSQLATVLNGVVSQELIPRMDRKGIVAACEVMIVNSAIRNLIREGKPHQINSIIQTNADIGMQSLDSDLANLVLKGIISRENALARAQDDKILSKLLEQGW